MQPYFLPYLGYFRLLANSDKFIILDDVNYIKKGWINRNNFYLNEKSHRWTLPLTKISQNKKINELTIFEPEINLLKLKKLITNIYYNKNKNQKKEFDLIDKIFENPEDCNISNFIEKSIIYLLKYYEISLEIHKSSNINIHDKYLKGQDRIISLCKYFNASVYLNLPGGIDLYSKEKFNRNNIALIFIDVDHSIFKEQNISIIHYLFNYSKSDVRSYLLKSL